MLPFEFRELPCPEIDESGVQRCFVSLPDPSQPATLQSQKDRELWDAMDQATDQVARIFANGNDFEIFTPSGPIKVAANADLRPVLPYSPGRRDGIGTTHHEARSLAMGTNSAVSATNADGRLHDVANAYIAGPALFPSLGSPNPMLTGVALSRRLVDRLVMGGLMPSAQPVIPDGLRGKLDLLGIHVHQHAIGAAIPRRSFQARVAARDPPGPGSG